MYWSIPLQKRKHWWQSQKEEQNWKWRGRLGRWSWEEIRSQRGGSISVVLGGSGWWSFDVGSQIPHTSTHSTAHTDPTCGRMRPVDWEAAGWENYRDKNRKWPIREPQPMLRLEGGERPAPVTCCKHISVSAHAKPPSSSPHFPFLFNSRNCQA